MIRIEALLGEILSIRTIALALVASSALIMMSGCGGSADKPSNDSSIKVKDNSSPTPKPADELQTSYPEISLEFSKLPDVDKSQKLALKTFVDFKRGLQQTTRQVKIDPLLEENASKEVIDKYRGSLDYLKKNDKRYGGTRRIVSVKVASARDTVIGFRYCTDAKDLTIVTAGKSAPVDGPKRVLSLNILTQIDGRWLVTEDRTLDGTC